MIINYGTEIPNLERRKCIVINPVNYVININGMIFTLYKIIIMKNIKTLLALLLINTYLFSQDPPIPNINNLTPKWYHVLVDTNFVQDTFGTNIDNPYTICFPNEYKTIGDKLLINNHCTTGLGDRHGNLIQYIDISTGKMRWARALNNDNYLVNQEFFPGMFYVEETDEVVLKGFRKYGSPAISSPSWRFNFPSLLSTISLNAKDGSLKNHITNEDVRDTIPWNPTSNAHFLKTSDNKVWMASAEFVPIKDFLIKVYELTENQKFVTTPALEYFYEKSDLLPYDLYHVIGSDNNDNFYFTFLEKEIFAVSPFHFNLFKAHIETDGKDSEPQLRTVFSKDLSPYLQVPESVQGFFPRFKIYDDVIYLSMVYTDTLDNNEIKRWLLCLDADGNERFYIKSLGADSQSYSQAIVFLGRKNGKTYFAIEGKDESEYSRHIMSVDDQGNIKKHTTLKTGDSALKINGLRGAISDSSDDVILAIQVNNMYYYTVAYDPLDLGIDFTSTTNEQTAVSKDFSFYPNPVYNDLIVQRHIETDRPVTATLIDIFGRTILTQALDQQINYLDISGMYAGLYFVKIADNEGKTIKIQKVMKASK